jgi:predicted GIY-YIG superfamily endonuclease
MGREYHFYVYIMQSVSRRALYIGLTNNLRRRVLQHKTHAFEGFTNHYNAERLVYYERFDDVRTAINREKQTKALAAREKIWLIERMNPGWKDLAADSHEPQGPSTRAEALARDDKVR